MSIRSLALALGVSLAIVGLALPAHASKPDPKAKAAAKPAAKGKAKGKKKEKGPDEEEFQKRLSQLKAESSNEVIIKMLPTDDPAKLPKLAGGPDLNGPVMVASARNLYTPETLSPHDILKVINKNLVDIRKCYKKQLASDPEWNDELILDLSIKKTGRVSEVNVSPRRVRRDIIGECLISTVPKWKFPEFTGESDDGVSQEIVNASFPFNLSPQPAE